MSIDPVGRLLLGLLTGVAFGFLLQKGRVAKLPVIVGQFLLEDWTVAKIMGTAIAVGALGLHVLLALGLTELSIRPLFLGGTIGGAVLFGIGMAVLGYCPGTGVAASGEGHRDAWVGVVGMFAGAVAFVASYPWLQPLLEAGPYGRLTLSEASGVPAWFFVTVLLLSVAIAAVLPRSWQRRRSGPRHGDPGRPRSASDVERKVRVGG